jgi:hypothetical protein
MLKHLKDRQEQRRLKLSQNNYKALSPSLRDIHLETKGTGSTLGYDVQPHEPNWRKDYSVETASASLVKAA